MPKKLQDEGCGTCRYRNRWPLKEPCSTGTYQMLYSKRCFCYKPLRWWQRAIDRLLYGRGSNDE